MKNHQTSTDEINFFKEFYREEPHMWVDPLSISKNDWPPPKDWLEEPPHLEHKVKKKRGAVCLCVWEKFHEATNRSLIDYFKLIIPQVHLPLDLDVDMNIVDGRHRLIAYKELGSNKFILEKKVNAIYVQMSFLKIKSLNSLELLLRLRNLNMRSK